MRPFASVCQLLSQFLQNPSGCFPVSLFSHLSNLRYIPFSSWELLKVLRMVGKEIFLLSFLVCIIYVIYTCPYHLALLSGDCGRCRDKPPCLPWWNTHYQGITGHQGKEHGYTKRGTWQESILSLGHHKREDQLDSLLNIAGKWTTLLTFGPRALKISMIGEAIRRSN